VGVGFRLFEGTKTRWTVIYSYDASVSSREAQVGEGGVFWWG